VIQVPEEPDWPNVRREGPELFTANALPGRSVYGEKLLAFDGVEHRAWDPWRSKLAAYLLRGGAPLRWSACRRLLYLGGAHGTTVSHLADMLPATQFFVVEKSPTSFGALLALAKERTNLLPILADAHLPERYRAEVGLVEVIYQDIAQADQAEILAENARACLGAGGEALLFLKVRSVTQRRPAGEIVDATRRTLKAAGLTVRSTVNVAPFARDHLALAISG
jgi:fibrillarin-like pre-rRNA processing protein